MCCFTSQSTFPPTFTISWGMWTVLDIAFAIVGYLTRDDICQAQPFPFDLALWVCVLGLIGVVVNAVHTTVEVNPSYIPKKLAIFLRIILALSCLAWFTTGIIYFVYVPQECRMHPLFALSIIGLAFMFAKSIALQLSTNYGFQIFKRDKPVSFV